MVGCAYLRQVSLNPGISTYLVPTDYLFLSLGSIQDFEYDRSYNPILIYPRPDSSIFAPGMPFSQQKIRFLMIICHMRTVFGPKRYFFLNVTAKPHSLNLEDCSNYSSLNFVYSL